MQREFAESLGYARLDYSFLPAHCKKRHAGHLVAFSCKKHVFCPNCGARCMAERAALLVEEMFPEQLVRKWVLGVMTVEYHKTEVGRCAIEGRVMPEFGQ